MAVRKVITIDEEKCDGCGNCVPACAEGAVQVINGKARLVNDVYCDGLGACLGECPQGAITLGEREAEAFDPVAVHAHLSRVEAERKPRPAPAAPAHGGHACPGSLARMLSPQARPAAPSTAGDSPSALANWPVQLHLIPPQAPYFQGADLLISADCVPFAFAGFHSRLLAGRVVAIGCPKLDDGQSYLRKLAAIFAQNDIRSITVAYMEVPCCFGLVHMVRLALGESGKEIPLTLTKIGIRGEELDTHQE